MTIMSDLASLKSDNKTKHPSNKCIYYFIRHPLHFCLTLTAHKMSYDLISFAYAAMVALGGIIGFVKKGIVN